MDAKFIAIVQAMLAKNGKDILFDSARFKSALPGEAQGAFKKERHVLSVAIERGAGREIDAADDLPAVKQKLTDDLMDRFHIARPGATETIELMAHLLRGDRAPAVTESPLSRAKLSSSPITKKTRRKHGRLILASIALIALIAALILAHRLVRPVGDPREIPTNERTKSITVEFRSNEGVAPGARASRPPRGFSASGTPALPSRHHGNTG
jgi:hypothetical protein